MIYKIMYINQIIIDTEQCIVLNLVQCVNCDLNPTKPMLMKTLELVRNKNFYYHVQNEMSLTRIYDIIFDFSGSTKSSLKVACTSKVCCKD